jgi:hypothetical protein
VLAKNRQEVLGVNHSVFVTYVFPQKPLPKTLTFKDEGKMRELARRSETSAQPTSRRRKKSARKAGKQYPRG